MNCAVSVNPKAISYGNTEAIPFGGESVETTRAASLVDEDIVRPVGKPAEASGNDLPHRKVSNNVADEAGFYFNPAQGPTAINVPPGTLVSPFGIPVYKSSNVEDTHMIVGDFSKLKVYYGESFRVDSSDVAGTRWDTNLIGFRGEQEMGLDARPAVYAGHFALVEDITP